MPGPRVNQVKLLSSLLSAVTCHLAGGRPGCRISTRLPTASGPPSNRWMLVTVGVHSGQRSISRITAQTLSGGASISTVRRKSSMPEVFIIHKLDLLRQFHIVKSRSGADGGSMPYASAFLASLASLTDAFGPPSVAPPVSLLGHWAGPPRLGGMVGPKSWLRDLQPKSGTRRDGPPNASTWVISSEQRYFYAYGQEPLAGAVGAEWQDPLAAVEEDSAA
jgi:hypothetical protein